MTSSSKITLAAAMVGLLAAPGLAEVARADQDRIARSLAAEGYSDVTIHEADGAVVVSATREGAVHSFAYDAEGGMLDPVGDDDDDDDGRPGDTGSPGSEASDDDEGSDGDTGGPGAEDGNNGNGAGGDDGQGGGGDEGGGGSEGGDNGGGDGGEGGEE